MKGVRLALVCGLLALSAGCATGPYADSRDPFEPLNRSIYSVNEKLDADIAQPVAKTYEKVVPSVVRTGVSNFFGNLGDLWSAVNALLQGKAEASGTNFMRFTTNSVFGIGGLIDVASEMNMRRTSTGMSDTLGVWGVPTGPYVVLPLLGPSTARGVTGLVVEGQAGVIAAPISAVNDSDTRLGLTVLSVVDQRARLLGVTDQIGALALDPYSFVRDAYLQREAHKISPQQ